MHSMHYEDVKMVTGNRTIRADRQDALFTLHPSPTKQARIYYPSYHAFVKLLLLLLLPCCCGCLAVAVMQAVDMQYKQ